MHQKSALSVQSRICGGTKIFSKDWSNSTTPKSDDRKGEKT